MMDVRRCVLYIRDLTYVHVRDSDEWKLLGSVFLDLSRIAQCVIPSFHLFLNMNLPTVKL